MAYVTTDHLESLFGLFGKEIGEIGNRERKEMRAHVEHEISSLLKIIGDQNKTIEAQWPPARGHRSDVCQAQSVRRRHRQEAGMSRKDSDELDSVSASFALDFEACQLLRDAQTCAESRGVWADAAQEARQALDLLDLLPSRATFH